MSDFIVSPSDPEASTAIPIDPSLLSPQTTTAGPISPSAIPDNSDIMLPSNEAESSTQPQWIPTSTLEAAMSTIDNHAHVETPVPFIPSAGVNGRRASTSGGKGVNGQHRSVGPELIPPSKLSQASGGAFVPTGQPPYQPPEDIIYPQDGIPNPYWGDMSPQPIIENFPANSLYRPKFLPSDIDDRLDKRSVWIGVEKDSARAVYFLPPTCQCCKNPAVAQHCDRGWPNCARCVGRGVACIPGKAWGMMRPKGKRRNLKAEAAKPKASDDTPENAAPGPSKAAQRSTPSSNKGKGKASAHTYIPPPPLPALPSFERDSAINGAETVPNSDQKGQKKRKLSISVQGDPKRVRRKSNRDSLGPLPLSTDLPLSRADQAYFARLEENAKKPPLRDMYGPCPVWAKTRKSLQSAAEYLRDPKRTAGASVEIGAGGLARGVILEGEVPGAQGIFWGTGKDAGTIITAIGSSREQIAEGNEPVPQPRIAIPPAEKENTDQFSRSTSPPLNILPSVFTTQSAGPGSTALDPKNDQKPEIKRDRLIEQPEVAALLMAVRARTPVAVAVAQDYAAVPFKVPRPFIILGWLWITDAWLEPVMPDLRLFCAEQSLPSGPPNEVIWKFRFEWCTGGTQDLPWWDSDREPKRPINPASAAASDHDWALVGQGEGSTTVSLPVTDTPTDASKEYQHSCEACGYTSERVYATGDICLHEACDWFFGDASSQTNRIGPITNQPGPVRPKVRIQPETVGLRLRPPQPTGLSHDVTQAHAGRDFWRGWVCDKCGLAQERYKWSGWSCEACGHTIQPSRRIYTAEDLRSPSRPVCTSTRQEDGYASLPFKTQRSWSLFPHHIKVVKHTLDADLFGDQSQVQHSLAHAGNGVNEIADRALRELQVQGATELPLRRYTANSNTRRPVELALSPFYTYLCGPDPSSFGNLPTCRSVQWQDAPSVCLDIIDLINARAGNMFPSQSDLLIKLNLEPNTYMAVLFLGSDATIRIRNGTSTRHKQGEVTAQHGDVIGFKAGERGIEASLRMDNFGFFCIARHSRVSDSMPPQTATSDSHFSIDSFAPHLRAGSDYQPSSSVEPLSATFPPVINQDNDLSAQSVPITPLFAPKKAQSRSKSTTVPKIVKLAKMSLENWYIGAYALSTNQCLRILRPYRPETSDDIQQETLDTGKVANSYDNVIMLDQEEEEFIQIDPVPLSPLPGYDDLFPEPEPEPELLPPSKKNTPAGKKGKSAAASEAIPKATATMTPTGTSGKKRKGPRISTSATPAGSVIDPEERTPSSKGTPSSRGGRKKAAKGRKSLA
uniref:Uncharacterized protein n=1 Tax=Kwoniella dejecticola CBS 10117 TaxID=1296121 RepID=A0A1A6A853_9TREE|nr:uncharacterized protein I303_03964 [Kwoniella dejecticola CBS 10117]OBR86244.1 hypothetical protein I303_03964 [Kwoniella dejecticola CBS 10117]